MTYKDRLRKYDRGQWFQFPLRFLSILKEREAVLLGQLINLSFLAQDCGRDKDDWFRARTEYLAKPLYTPPQRVERTLHTLESYGLICCEIRGMSRMRWVWIDLDYLDEALSIGAKLTECKDAKMRQRKDADQSPCIIVITKKKEKHCPDCAGTVWRDCGISLRDAISKVTTVPHSAKPVQWGASIRAIHVRDGVSVRRVEEILTWYCKMLPKEGDINTNGNPNRIPIAYSGDSFRRKFTSLEGAHSRDSRYGARAGKKMKVRETIIDENGKDITDEWENK